MKNLLILILLLSMSLVLTAQTPHLDVEGDARIVGKVNLIAGVGDSSVFIGANAGMNDDGNDNGNTFVGLNSGRSNTSGGSNSFFGRSSGESNINGGFNSFFGRSSGESNTNGSSNSFFGFLSGLSNTLGGSNSFFGFQSGLFNTTGFENTYIGKDAGRSTNSTRSTMVGTFSESVSGHSLDRAIAIGYNAQVDCDNCAVIGGTGVDAVKVGIGTTVPEEELHVVGNIRTDNMLILHGASSVYGNGVDDAVIFGSPDHPGGDLILVSNELVAIHIDQDLNNTGSFKVNKGTGFSNTLLELDHIGNLTIDGCYKSGSTNIGGTCISDKNYKTNINSLSSQLSLMTALRPVVYDWISSDLHPAQEGDIGLIAQEVEQVIPEMVSTDESGVKRVKYDLALQIRMIKAIQELAAQNDAISKQNKQVTAENEELKKRLARLESIVLGTTQNQN